MAAIARGASEGQSAMRHWGRRGAGPGSWGIAIVLQAGAPAARPTGQDVGMVEQPIEQRRDGGGVAQELAPVFHGAIRSNSVESGNPAPSGLFVCFPLALGLLGQRSNDFNVD